MEHFVPRKTIEQLRKIREERGLSYQDIIELGEKNGEIIPVTTLRRIMTADLDVVHFRRSTIVPVENVLLDMDEPTVGMVEPETVDIFKRMVNALNQQLEEERTANIQRLEIQKQQYESQIQSIKDYYSAQALEVAKANQSKIDHIKDELALLKDELSIKNRRIDERDEIIRKFILENIGK